MVERGGNSEGDLDVGGIVSEDAGDVCWMVADYGVCEEMVGDFGSGEGVEG